jgi:hypothetical protein
MIEMTLCPECGVPELLTATHTWLGNGTIILNTNPQIRLIIHESQNLDPLFAGISNIIGKPVEPIIIDSMRRASRVYMSANIPADTETRLKAGEIDLYAIGEMTTLFARGMGYGNVTVVDGQYKGDEDDYVVVRYTEPHCAMLLDGNIVGCVEAVVRRGISMEHKQISADTHELRLTMSEQPSRTASINVKMFQTTGGDIELKRCSSCGGPAALSDYKWDLARGVVTLEPSGRRICMLGPIVMDPLFEALETELGESIQAAVIEAQRRFVRGGMYSVSEVRSESQMREFFALRGLGYIRELRMGRKGVRFGIDNAHMHLMIVGQTQGMYELAFGKESQVEWEVNDEGTLLIEVTPWD